MLLAGLDLDTPEVRKALVNAAEDEDNCVRAKAVVGLAQRDRALALPLVKRELGSEYVAFSVFEAAEMLTDPSLISLLEHFANPSNDQVVDQAVLHALAACRGETRAV